MKSTIKNNQQQKMDFLDRLEPDDLRNGENFNQIDKIIEHISQSLLQAIANKENPDEFINKAVKNLFRENSPALEKATRLLKNYAKMIDLPN